MSCASIMQLNLLVSCAIACQTAVFVSCDDRPAPAIFSDNRIRVCKLFRSSPSLHLIRYTYICVSLYKSKTKKNGFVYIYRLVFILFFAALAVASNQPDRFTRNEQLNLHHSTGRELIPDGNRLSYATQDGGGGGVGKSVAEPHQFRGHYLTV